MARPVAQRGEGRQRVLDAALGLFAEHGVSGTSLQDIADTLGVTKAAVYFQFHTKREIVLAVVEPLIAQLDGVVAAASARRSPNDQRQVMLEGLVDVAIAASKLAAFLQQDRFVAELIASDPGLQALTDRVGELLAGPSPSPRVRVAVALVGQGIAQARSTPALADLDDETLRHELLVCARSALASASRA